MRILHISGMHCSDLRPVKGTSSLMPWQAQKEGASAPEDRPRSQYAKHSPPCDGEAVQEDGVPGGQEGWLDQMLFRLVRICAMSDWAKV